VREIFTSQDVTEVGFYKSILDEADIATFIRNENTGNPALSGAAFSPSLCVVDDADYDEAVRILKEHQDKVVAGAVEWTCPSCAEKNPPNFEVCWKCNTPRPEA
jgi:hypothetical protein